MIEANKKCYPFPQNSQIATRVKAGYQLITTKNVLKKVLFIKSNNIFGTLANNNFKNKKITKMSFRVIKIKCIFPVRYYGAAFLPSSCKINKINMQENHVNMHDNYVDMQVKNRFKKSYLNMVKMTY